MRYYDDVMFVTQEEDPGAPGNWPEEQVIKPYKGEWKRLITKWTPGSSINDDKRVNNQLEIIADSFASENFTEIRAIKYRGKWWSVNTVTLALPRIILEIGDLYHA